MQNLNSSAAQAALEHITHIYTDLDGTLLAPGGKLLTNHNGKPSLSLANALVQLKRLGMEIVIVTGRDAASCTEIMRLTNLNQFIAEMGCIVQYGYGANVQKSYRLGAWSGAQLDQDFDHETTLTPYEMIANSDTLSKLLSHFKGKLEIHTLKGGHREVTFLMRGSVDTTPGGEVEQVLSECEIPLQLLDNGVIHPQNHGLLEVDAVHVYHLMPRGTGKGEAVAADMAEKGLTPKQTLSIGDAEGDISMGVHTGSFVLVNDHKKPGPNKYAEATVANPEALFTTSLPTADGWVEFAHALLAAKEGQSQP